jgi:HK97 family phage prohead protease
LNAFTGMAAGAASFTRARLKTAGSFEGYASVFGAEDQGRDVVMPGAFRVSLARAGAAKVRMLFQHDPAQPVGVWDEIREDARGLYVRGRLTLEVARAGEILALMREGALDGLSIGFRARKAVRDARSGLRRLYEIDLWEISIVTFPMLPDARVSAVKSACFSARPQTALASPRLEMRRLRGSPAHANRAHPPARCEARPGGGPLPAVCRSEQFHQPMRMT